MTRRLTFAMLAFAILAGCSKEKSPQPTPTPVKYDLVVTLQLNNNEGFRMVKYDQNGIGETPFINYIFPDKSLLAQPRLSGNGRKIVYVAGDSIYVMDVATKLSTFIYKHDNMLIVTPGISYDGSKLTFAAFPPATMMGTDLYILNATPGSIPVNITNNPDHYYAMEPSFSRDASKVAYTNYLEDDLGVYVSDLQGNNKVRISETHSSGGTEDEHAIFTADGSRLIFVSNRYSSNYWSPGEIVVTNINAGAEVSATRLTTASVDGMYTGGASFPVLSDDGQTLFFIGGARGNRGIFRMPVSGGTPELVAVIAAASAGEYVSGLAYVKR